MCPAYDDGQVQPVFAIAEVPSVSAEGRCSATMTNGRQSAMHEEILARFFEGEISGKELADDLEGSERRLSDVATVTRVEDTGEGFTVTRDMAIRLCDSFLNGELEASALATLGFALMASDRFTWDAADILGDVIADWSCPEINYPLTVANVSRCRAWLAGEEPYPPRAANRGKRGKLLSVRYKNSPKQ